MTLIITVLAEDVIYQSADFRLSAAGAAPFDRSTKLVSVDGWEWRGTVTYTGVGLVGNRDTAQQVVGWLTGHEDLSFEQAAEVIRSRGSAWLRRIARTEGSQRHTFVLATFQNGIATVALVSNFESIGQPRADEARPELRTSFVRYRNRPVVLMTGYLAPGVSRRQRQMLKYLVRDHSDDPARIRHAMQELNRQAAQAAGHRGPISEECAVHSLDRAGRTQQGGRVPGAEFRQVIGGIDVGTALNRELRRLFSGSDYQMVGATSVTSTSARSPVTVCSPRLILAATAGDYELTELASGAGMDATAAGVNQSGVVVGHSRRVPGGPVFAVQWPANGAMVFLEDPGGITGQANAINDSGVTVGTIEDHERHTRACRWDRNGALTLLHVEGATHSGARSINQAGDVAGWVSFHPSEGGQQHFRPAVWQHDGLVGVLHDLPAGWWGEAIAVNDRRQILIWAQDGMRAFPILSQDGNAMPLVEANQNLVPVALDASGRVYGWIHDAEGRISSMVCTAETGWRPLGTEPDWRVTGCSANGVIVGVIDVDGFRRPWILEAGCDPQVLPHYAYHFNEPNAVLDGGVLCGKAASDHGGHALVWRRRD